MYKDNLIFFQLCLILKPLVKEMYLVGGCVRDMLLQKTPKDLDLVVDGDLDIIEKELKENGWKVSGVGKKFFVLVASKDKQLFEIALFRKDGTYTDGRRPDYVDIGTMEEDALRRDFTINSLYLDPFTEEVLDPTKKGLKDLKDKVIRFNGKSKDRILEDKLRILRCYRFASKLKFTIQPKTLKDCRTYFDAMQKEVSSQRILNEIEKMVGISNA